MSDYTKALCGDWLNGKTVIVTGASGGMGAGIAATLIKKHNCRVVGVARNEAKMLKFIEEINFLRDIFVVSGIMNQNPGVSENTICISSVFKIPMIR